MTTLHDLLLNVKREGDSICHQCMDMKGYTHKLEQELDELLKRWPRRASGVWCAPVEGTLSKFHEASTRRTLWDNARRHDLLTWLLEETK